MKNESLLMITIFQQADGKTEVSAEEYLGEKLDFEIYWVGQVFKCLGLAQTAAAQSDLGWEPAPILMKIIADRAARPSVKEKRVWLSEYDEDFVRSLMMRATGEVSEDHWPVNEFCCSVLVALGLMKKGRPEGYKPTPRLRDLMLLAPLQQPVEAART
jgi:hypothetical protein